MQAKKELMMVRAEISGLGNKKTIEKINKNLLFENKNN